MELDDLKSAWKAAPQEKKYNQNHIIEMLKKKSSSTIKYLFQFTLIEFLLVFIFTIVTIIKGKLIFGNHKLINDSTNFDNYLYGSILTMAFTFCLLIYSYKTYKSLNVNQNTKVLIEKIVSYRNVVNLFIFGVAIALIIISIPYYYNLGQVIYLNKINDTVIDDKAKWMGILAVGISIFFITIITLVYYSFIYFIFLKKLNQNLAQLKSLN